VKTYHGIEQQQELSKKTVAREVRSWGAQYADFIAGKGPYFLIMVGY